MILRWMEKFQSYILKSVLELNFAECSPKPSTIKDTFDVKRT